MNFDNLKIKVTKEGVVFEKISKNDRGRGLVTTNKTTKPIDSEKQYTLKRLGYSDKEIARMLKFKPKKRVYSDGGFSYI